MCSNWSSMPTLRISMKNLKKLDRNQLKVVLGGLACRTDDFYCPGESVCCMSGRYGGLCRLPSQMSSCQN